MDQSLCQKPRTSQPQVWQHPTQLQEGLNHSGVLETRHTEENKLE